jgi:hypothetical protein
MTRDKKRKTGRDNLAGTQKSYRLICINNPGKKEGLMISERSAGAAGQKGEQKNRGILPGPEPPVRAGESLAVVIGADATYFCVLSLCGEDTTKASCSCRPGIPAGSEDLHSRKCGDDRQIGPEPDGNHTTGITDDTGDSLRKEYEKGTPTDREQDGILPQGVQAGTGDFNSKKCGDGQQVGPQPDGDLKKAVLTGSGQDQTGAEQHTTGQLASGGDRS